MLGVLMVNHRYRPGNLLVGGGGRGVRVAPEHLGTGEWEVVHDKGNMVGEVLVKKSACKQDAGEKSDRKA